MRHWLKIYRLESGLDIVLKTYDLGPLPVIMEMSGVFLPFSHIPGQIYRRMPLVACGFLPTARSAADRLNQGCAIVR